MSFSTGSGDQDHHVKAFCFLALVYKGSEECREILWERTK